MTEGRHNAPLTERVAEALDALGNAYRGDWSDMDGRTLRDELERLAAVLRAGDAETPFDLEGWYLDEGICPKGKCWAEHCYPHTTDRWACEHLLRLRAKRGAARA